MSRHLRDLLTLLDSSTYEDSYGVYHSEFTVCRICESESGAGVLARPNWHKAGCPVPRMQAKYQERGRRSRRITQQLTGPRPQGVTMSNDGAGVGPVERRVRPLAPMRAWRVYVRGWGDGPQAVTMATSRSKAQAKNHATANGVGYALKWGDFRVVRAPEFDAWFEKYGAFSWAWEHVQKMAEA